MRPGAPTTSWTICGGTRVASDRAGSALVILSTDSEEARFLTDLRANGLEIQPIAWRDFTNEIFTIYRVTEGMGRAHDHSV